MGKTGLEHQTRNGEALFTELRQLRQLIEELRTVQAGGEQALPVTGFPGPGQQYERSYTVAANTQKSFTFAVRTEGALAPTIWEPAVAVYVDTNVPDGTLMPDLATPTAAFLFPEGGSLTTGQKKLFYSVTRNPRYGLTPQDPENIGAWVIQLWNLDSASHTYYLKIRPFAAASLGPLVEV